MTLDAIKQKIQAAQLEAAQKAGQTNPQFRGAFASDMYDRYTSDLVVFDNPAEGEVSPQQRQDSMVTPMNQVPMTPQGSSMAQNMTPHMQIQDGMNGMMNGMMVPVQMVYNPMNPMQCMMENNAEPAIIMYPNMYSPNMSHPQMFSQSNMVEQFDRQAGQGYVTLAKDVAKEEHIFGTEFLMTDPSVPESIRDRYRERISKKSEMESPADLKLNETKAQDADSSPKERGAEEPEREPEKFDNSSEDCREYSSLSEPQPSKKEGRSWKDAASMKKEDSWKTRSQSKESDWKYSDKDRKYWDWDSWHGYTASEWKEWEAQQKRKEERKEGKRAGDKEPKRDRKSERVSKERDPKRERELDERIRKIRDENARQAEAKNNIPENIPEKMESSKTIDTQASIDDLDFGDLSVRSNWADITEADLGDDSDDDCEPMMTSIPENRTQRDPPKAVYRAPGYSFFNEKKRSSKKSKGKGKGESSRGSWNRR